MILRNPAELEEAHRIVPGLLHRGGSGLNPARCRTMETAHMGLSLEGWLDEAVASALRT